MNPTSTSSDFDVLLADGSTAHVRDICAADADGLRRFHASLSTQSIVMRFFGPHPVLADKEVERFTNVDCVDRVALVVERAGQMVAVARYDRSVGSDEAEVAFVVQDEFQGRGLATILLEHLASVARHHGIRRFIADTLSENSRMLGVFRDAGFARKYSRASEVVQVVLDIAPSPEALAATEERDRQAVVRSMQRLLRPASVAVIGASRARGTIGHQLLRNLLLSGFQGPVYPVNPATAYVASVPCWPTVEAIPGPVDLALIAVPAARVAGVVEECGRKGVGALVVITAGFAEAGADGARNQREITRLAHSYGMRIVGPNCFGVVNTDPAVSMNATFAPTSPLQGPIGFVSQSGGLGIALLREVTSRELGLSTFVSTGNKADISANDLLSWWEQDPATKVALLYLESFGNPRKFSRIARNLSRQKPIIAVKSGRSPAGTRGAASHTAALASSEDSVDALFRQTGVIRVDTIEELFDTAEVLAAGPLPAGRRVGILTNAGGPGVLAADACAGHGLEVPELQPATRDALGAFLPVGAGVQNPVDMIASASAETYGLALDLLLTGDEVDSVLVIFTPPLVTRSDDVATAVLRATEEAARAGHAKPVSASFLGAEGAPKSLRGDLTTVPCFTYPETAARALAHAVGYSRWRDRPLGRTQLITDVDANLARRLLETPPPDGWVTGGQAFSVLQAYGIPVAKTVTVRNEHQAESAATTLGFPVALKATGPGLVHKSDVGGVRLALGSAHYVREAYAEMAGSLGDAMDGAVVQPMAQSGLETIVGFVQDPAFGPLVLFGLGGTAVELLGDYATCRVPLTDVDAREMLLSLRSAPLLTGYRGSTPVDLDALVDLVLRCGQLAEDLNEVTEADFNPVIASENGVIVVDARLRVSLDSPAHDETRHLN
jgi:acetyl coenzyme A synthetase (ADP forming)-like protein